MSTETISKGTEPHLMKFERFEREPKQPAWLFPLRKAGLARFAERGFPTINDEDWRFTNVSPIAKLPFQPVFEPAGNGVDQDTVANFAFSSLPGTRLVFVNGHYAQKLSSPGTQQSGVKISSLAAALSTDPALLEKHLAQYA